MRRAVSKSFHVHWRWMYRRQYQRWEVEEFQLSLWPSCSRPQCPSATVPTSQLCRNRTLTMVCQVSSCAWHQLQYPNTCSLPSIVLLLPPLPEYFFVFRHLNLLERYGSQTWRLVSKGRGVASEASEPKQKRREKLEPGRYLRGDSGRG